jgi:hypothetical protein
MPRSFATSPQARSLQTRPTSCVTLAGTLLAQFQSGSSKLPLHQFWRFGCGYEQHCHPLPYNSTCGLSLVK